MGDYAVAMAALADITVVVLAAGLSQRFGTADKLLAPLRGKPLAAHVADLLGPWPFRQRLAVCGTAGVADLFRERGFTIVENPSPEQGQGASLALGLAAAEAPGILVCLADMPLVTAHHLEALCNHFDPGHGIWAVASVGNGQPGPPAVFARDHLAGLDLAGDHGARSLLRDALLVPAAAWELADFDTPEALSRAALPREPDGSP